MWPISLCIAIQCIHGIDINYTVKKKKHSAFISSAGISMVNGCCGCAPISRQCWLWSNSFFILHKKIITILFIITLHVCFNVQFFLFLHAPRGNGCSFKLNHINQLNENHQSTLYWKTQSHSTHSFHRTCDRVQWSDLGIWVTLFGRRVTRHSFYITIFSSSPSLFYSIHP